MEDAESVPPPRKRVKLEHHTPQPKHTKMSSSSDPGGDQDEVYHSAPEYAAAQEKLMKEDTAQDTRVIKEEDCGILEFVKPDNLGFSGILKKRYTDFLVNEISPSGEVLHLTELNPSKKINNLLKAEDEVWKKWTAESSNISIPATKPQNQDRVDIGKVNSSFAGKPSTSTSPNASTSQDIEQSTNTELIANTSLIKSEGNENMPLASANQASKSHDHLPNSGDPGVLSSVSSNTTIPSNNNGDEDPLAHHFMPAPPLPPHKRVPATKRSNPTNTVSVDGGSDDQVRRRYTHHIRLTSHGWVQFDKEKEDSEKAKQEKEAAERKADGELQELVPKEEQPVPQTVNYYKAAPSSVGSWNAYARSNSDMSEEDKVFLEHWFTKETIDSILSLYEKTTSPTNPPIRKDDNVETVYFDRESRGKIHEGIRRIFNSKLESHTDEAGRLVISPMPKQFKSHKTTSTSAGTKNTFKYPEMRGKARWPKFGGEYLHFSLYKENKDTMEVIWFLARQLRIKSKEIAFAGTKDRRGVTVQRLSLHRVGVDRVLRVRKSLRNAWVGNFEHQHYGLRLGDLKGNEFLITLRECNFCYPPTTSNAIIRKGAETIVQDSLQSLTDNGFINYFGLQRFGSFDVSTHTIGIAMLQGEFLTAVEAILYYKPACLKPELEETRVSDAISQDDRARAEGIHAFLILDNPDLALTRIPRKFSAESSIIRHLSKKGQQNDYLGALMAIPRNQRLMYIHAYQSLVWNHVASRRWNWSGDKVVSGDLVLVKEHEDGKPIKKEEVDADGEVIVEPGDDDSFINPDDKFVRARPLTAIEACSGKYTIFDIVLPTPGYDIIYPPNVFGDYYREFMASDSGGKMDLNDMRRKERDISLSGTYRKLIAKPQNASFEIKVYEDEDEQFVETDLEKYRKAHPKEGYLPKSRKPAKRTAKLIPNAPLTDNNADGSDLAETYSPAGWRLPPRQVNASPPSSTNTDSSGGVIVRDWYGHRIEPTKIAVILKMQLGAGEYATMALRELMKKGGVKSHKSDYSGGH